MTKEEALTYINNMTQTYSFMDVDELLVSGYKLGYLNKNKNLKELVDQMNDNYEDINQWILEHFYSAQYGIFDIELATLFIILHYLPSDQILKVTCPNLLDTVYKYHSVVITAEECAKDNSELGKVFNRLSNMINDTVKYYTDICEEQHLDMEKFKANGLLDSDIISYYNNPSIKE